MKMATDAGVEVISVASADVGRTSEADVPVRLTIVPWGDVESERGNFVVDEEAAGLVIEAFRRHKTDVPIDYEHQTLGGSWASPNGQAPAAGWITDLEIVDGEGIVASVTWTPMARVQLSERQYRYLSPVAIVRKADRKLMALHSVALTNKPAIVGMKPIVNQVRVGIEDPIDALRTQLGMDESVDADEVVLAASARIQELDDRERLIRAEQRVGEAVRGGRLSSAQRSWATRLILKDESLFDDWLASAPVVVSLGKTAPPERSEGASSAMVHRARSEFRSHPELAALTSEDAYVADALRVGMGAD